MKPWLYPIQSKQGRAILFPNAGIAKPHTANSYLLAPPAPREHHITMAAQILTLTVHGMTCANCARSVERKLRATPGVTKASVDLLETRATVEYDADLVKPEMLANAVRSLGYEVPA